MKDDILKEEYDDELVIRAAHAMADVNAANQGLRFTELMRAMAHVALLEAGKLHTEFVSLSDIERQLIVGLITKAWANKETETESRELLEILRKITGVDRRLLVWRLKK